MQAKISILSTALLLLIIVFSACDINHSSEDNNSYDIIRYDKMLFNLDTGKIEAEFKSIQNSYPAFTDIYFEKVLDMPYYKKNDSLFYSELKWFVTDTAMRRIYNLVNEEFGDMKELKKKFGKALSNYNKLFPNDKSPRIYSYISGFSIQRFIFEDDDREGLAFGTDLFLGKNFPYERLERGDNTFSKYLIRTYDKKHLVKKVLELSIEDKLGEVPGNRAIDYMIRNGKKYYILKQIIPDIQDSVLFEYSGKQMNWLHNNEQEMWKHYIKNGYFYTTDGYKIKRLTSPGPNSQALGMPIESPGYTGNYFGYRILDTYLRRNEKMSIPSLIKLKDSQKILEQSRFKPKRK